MVVIDNAKNIDSSKWYALYIFLCLAFLASSIGGSVGLYQVYAGCDFALAFVIISTVVGFLQLVMSMIVVSPWGIVTPLFIWTWNIFMTW